VLKNGGFLFFRGGLKNQVEALRMLKIAHAQRSYMLKLSIP
jgi:hypothetical protein